MKAINEIMVNGKLTDSITVADRGLQYGDGVWETLVVRDGKIMQLSRHLARLQKGVHALSIRGYRDALLLEELKQFLSRNLTNTAQAQPCILKIIVTRGLGGRGYNPQGCKHPTRILSLHPWPDYPVDYASTGVKITLCNSRLSHNPALSGFKHLNRLEQVLARAEFDDHFQEGLVRDHHGHIIEATMSNVFIVQADKRIITPELSGCGIEGIARSCILDELQKMSVQVSVTNVSVEDVLQAQGVFLSNSVIQVWPVKQFQQRQYIIPEMVTTLQERLKGKL